jgi:hypothetical protein
LLSVRAKAFDDLGMPKCARLAASDNHKQCALLVTDVDEPSHGRARERDSVPGAKLHRLALVLAPEEAPPAVEYYEGLVRVVGVVGDPVVRFDLQESDVQPLIYINGRPGGAQASCRRGNMGFSTFRVSACRVVRRPETNDAVELAVVSLIAAVGVPTGEPFKVRPSSDPPRHILLYPLVVHSLVPPHIKRRGQTDLYLETS